MKRTTIHTTLKLAHELEDLRDLAWQALPYLQLVAYLQK